MQNKRSLLVFIILPLLLITAWMTPVTALGDMGPKPRIEIDFDNVDGPCYVTLLFSPDCLYGEDSLSYGPWHVASIDTHSQDAIVNKFLDYKDEDGYRFVYRGSIDDVQVKDEVSNSIVSITPSSTQYKWGYMRPEKFKVLIYNADKDEFLVSEPCEAYAFEAIYRTDLQAAMKGEGLVLVASGQYMHNAPSFLSRMLATVLIEIVVAFFFSIRDKNSLLLILIMNVITQIGLNLGLVFLEYCNGWFAMLAAFALMEVMIILIEAGVYMKKLPVYNPDYTKGKVLIYTIVANLVSYGLGRILMMFV